MKMIFMSLHVLLFLMLSVCTLSAAEPQKTQSSSTTMQISKNREIQDTKPKKPVKIKLHRSSNGGYSWDITGESADEVFRADSRLRKLYKLDTQ